MLVVAPSQLRADFQRYYGLDIDEIGYTIRVRRAADLAANLPEQATIWRAINPQAAWDTSQYLLADMADSLRFLTWAKHQKQVNVALNSLTRFHDQEQTKPAMTVSSCNSTSSKQTNS